MLNYGWTSGCLLCKYQWRIVRGMGHAGCMHACPCFLHLDDAVDSNTLFYIHLFPVGLKGYSLDGQGELSPWPQRDYGRAGC